MDEVLDLFTVNQYNKDKQFIVELNKDVRLNGIESYFRINENGRNLVYTLTVDKYISPIFFIKLNKFSEKKPKHKKDKEYYRFEYAMKIIEKLLDKKRKKNYLNTNAKRGYSMA